jgi:hypothetical protein
LNPTQRPAESLISEVGRSIVGALASAVGGGFAPRSFRCTSSR